MNMIAILLGLVALLVLTLKKVPLVFTGMISVIVVALFSRMDVVETVTTTYVDGMTTYISKMWLLFMFGTILSGLMDRTGAARAIADWIVSRLGMKRAIPAVIVAGGVLTYGGVNTVVCAFAMYPIALSIFRQANLPRYLIPAAIASGVFSWSSMLPGTPADQNILPTPYMDTTPMAAPIIGVVAALITLVLSFWYLSYQGVKAQKAGIGFEVDDSVLAVLKKSDEMKANGTLPNPILALLPLICVAILLNIVMVNVSVALVAGIVLCLLLFYKNLKGENIGTILTACVKDASVSVVVASALAGFGNVIKAAPGFQTIVDGILNYAQNGGLPLLVIFGLATTALCGLNASGSSGLTTTLTALSESFINMGVAPALIHRIGVIASVGLDSVPWSGGVVTLITLSGVTYKDAYKHVFMTTVVFTLTSLGVAMAMGTLFGAI